MWIRQQKSIRLYNCSWVHVVKQDASQSVLQGLIADKHRGVDLGTYSDQGRVDNIVSEIRTLIQTGHTVIYEMPDE